MIIARKHWHSLPDINTHQQNQLKSVIAAREQASHVALTCSGHNAVVLAIKSSVKRGDHLLVTKGLYGGAHEFFTETVAGEMGVNVKFFDPRNSVDQITSRMNEKTRAIFLLTPSSHLFEMQDIPALCAEAKKRKIVSIVDASWSGSLFFKPLIHADVSVLSLTKFYAGESRAAMGAIATNREDLFAEIERNQMRLGILASSLNAEAIILQSLNINHRLRIQFNNAVAVARHLQSWPEIKEVHYPALGQNKGHALWSRDYTGAGSLFSVEFNNNVTPRAVEVFIEKLKIFDHLHSWGGRVSRCVPFRLPEIHRAGPDNQFLRLYIGRPGAGVDGLIHDLEQSRAQSLQLNVL